jgi:hypothetical protein
MLVPATPVPQLQTVSDADDHDLLRQPGVLGQETRDHDPSGRVEVRVLGAAVEEPLELGQPRRQGGQLGERALRVALVLLRPPHPHAGLQVHRHRQDHALGHGRPVAGGHREAVLRVERMVEGAAKGDHC